MANEIENTFEEELAEERHREVLSALKKVYNSISPNSDPELKSIIAKSSVAMDGLVSKIDKLNTVLKQEIKVDTHQSEVVKSIAGMAEAIRTLMANMEKRLAMLENKPRPKKLVAKRDAFKGTIDYFIIEYEK